MADLYRATVGLMTALLPRVPMARKQQARSRCLLTWLLVAALCLGLLLVVEERFRNSTVQAWKVSAEARRLKDISPNEQCRDAVAQHCKDVVPGEQRLLFCLASHVSPEETRGSSTGTPVSRECQGEMRAFRAEMYRDSSLDARMTHACKDEIAIYYSDGLDRPTVSPVQPKWDKGRLVSPLSGLNLSGVEYCRILHPEAQLGNCHGWFEYRVEYFSLDNETSLNPTLPDSTSLNQTQPDSTSLDQTQPDQISFDNPTVSRPARVRPPTPWAWERLSPRGWPWRLRLAQALGQKVTFAQIEEFQSQRRVRKIPGALLAYLRTLRLVGKLSGACAAEVVRAQQDAAEDFVMDPLLHEACSSDAARLCGEVQPGGGRIQECLRNKSWTLLQGDCWVELYRQEEESADDIRLNLRLATACREDQSKFCPGVEPGDARVTDCLEDHMEGPGFSGGCKGQLQEMMERRAKGERLNPTLWNLCSEDIAQGCASALGTEDMYSYTPECLQESRALLNSAQCRQQVHRIMKRASEYSMLDNNLPSSCEEDLERLCKDVPDGQARKFRCLQENREHLGGLCQHTLFSRELTYATDIDFKLPMRQACQGEMKRFCAGDIQGGDTQRGDTQRSGIQGGEGGLVIKCLREHTEDPGMGEKCREEVKRDEQLSAMDYQLNGRLYKECLSDVGRLCADACGKQGTGQTAYQGLLMACEGRYYYSRGGLRSSPGECKACNGTVLKCLSDNSDKLESRACREEVSFFERRMMADVFLDVPMLQACQDDLGKLCPSIGKNHTRLLQCLRQNLDALSEECKGEEQRFSRLEARHLS